MCLPEHVEIETSMNPYAAKKKTPAVAPEVTEELPTGSIAEVLAWVGEDKERAATALASELSGSKRASLIKTLKALVK